MKAPLKRSSVPSGLVLTCEHASRVVPAIYRRFLASSEARRALGSHRGFDPGALRLARRLQGETGVPLIAGEITRLLIDLNRSAEGRGLFSEFSRHLPPDLKARLRRVHEEHWRRVSGALESCLSRRARVVHVGVHTFTPVLGEEPRDFDVGVLYDPKRAREKELSLAIGDVLGELGLRVRRNAPYRGVADGMTTAFRRRLPQERYLGLELEFNQERFAKLRGGEAAIVHGLAARLLSPEIST